MSQSKTARGPPGPGFDKHSWGAAARAPSIAEFQIAGLSIGGCCCGCIGWGGAGREGCFPLKPLGDKISDQSNSLSGGRTRDQVRSACHYRTFRTKRGRSNTMGAFGADLFAGDSPRVVRGGDAAEARAKAYFTSALPRLRAAGPISDGPTISSLFVRLIHR